MSLEQTFGLLCEGSGGAYAPATIMVQQGTKAFFFLGSQDSLMESTIMEGFEIVESVDALEMIVEADGTKRVKDGKWIVEGPFQRSDAKNANGRTYVKKIWERIVKDQNSKAQQMVKGNRMVGHLEHPADGRTDGNLGALKIMSLKLREDGVVWGRAKVLNTDKGKNIRAYIEEGVVWGVSSRGNGSVDNKGFVNETDYQLVSFDAVMNPSTPGAFPKSVNASTNEDDSYGTHESVEELLAAAVTASEVDLTRLQEAGHYASVRGILGHLLEINLRMKSADLPPEDGTRIAAQLLGKLKESIDGLADFTEARIASLPDTDNPEAEDALTRMAETYDTRIGDAMEEINSLQGRLTDLNVRAENAESQVEALEDQRVALRDDLLEAETELKQVGEQLELATHRLEEQSAVTAANPIAEVVETAIKATPGLEDFRAALEAADTVEAVDAMVERLREAVVDGDATQRTATPPRRSLPPRGKVLESDALNRIAESASSDPGVQLAGVALNSMPQSK